jgi:hypothetical protein
MVGTDWKEAQPFRQTAAAFSQTPYKIKFFNIGLAIFKI